MTQYDDVSDYYVRLKQTDPIHQYAHYPSAAKFLGALKGRRILDVGCGDGEFCRRLAARGAFLTGYDNSEVQLQKARAKEKENPLGIHYLLARPSQFKSSNVFDSAVSVMVLPYAKNIKELEIFFRSTANVLREKGKFVSIIFNPEFKRLNKIIYYRRWTRFSKGTLRVEFFERGEVPFFFALFSDFSLKEYADAGKRAGFSNVIIKPVFISKQGLTRVGGAFWKGFLEDCPYMALIAKK